MNSRTVKSARIALLLVVVVAVRAAEPPESTLSRAQSLIEAGRFKEATALLEPHVDREAPISTEPARLIEIMRRIRLDHPHNAAQVLARLETRLHDVTAADVERWTAAGDLQHRVIDGEVRYFGRAVGNLLRFCPDAKKRQKATVAPAGWSMDLPAHLATLLREAKQNDKPLVHPVRHRVTYTLTVDKDHPRLRKGATVRCWLPFPQECRQQRDVRLVSTVPSDATVAPNGHPQRTIYFEQTIDDPTEPPKFSATYEFTTYAFCPDLDEGRVQPYDTDSELYRTYTAERPPHIVFTPRVKALVKRIVADEDNPLAKARRIFRWVSANVPWCAEMEYSTIFNLSDKGLSAGRGDCGVQGLSFITLCRAAGVPARWQSGWQSLPNDWNMHDWSEFYVEPWGWLPADASYGVQKHDDPQVQMFYCGRLDPYRMIVNLDYGRELHPPKTSFRSEPNDFQRGEIEIDGHNLYFDEWGWDFEVQSTPLTGDLTAVQEGLQAVVPDALRAGDIPGAVILVGRKSDGQYESWQQAYGFMQIEPHRLPMRTDAIFDLASMSKPIGAGSCLMKLVEAGKVDVGAPVSKYLPEFAEGDKAQVTVRHLMTHTSGMPPYVGAGEQKQIKAQAGYPCPDALRTYIRELSLRGEPGAQVTYSCLNAILCAEIVTAVSGQPLDTFAARIFGPLGLRDTMYVRAERNLALGVRSRFVPTTKADRGLGVGGFLQAQVHDPLAAMQGGVSGNAGLFSTAADLSRFAQMLLNDGVLDGVRIFKPETIKQMTSVQNPGVKNARGAEDRRGLLWDLYVPDPDDTGVAALFAYGHTGYTGTAIRIYPEHGVYIIALANRVHPDDSGKVGQFRSTVWKTVGATLMTAAGD